MDRRSLLTGLAGIAAAAPIAANADDRPPSALVEAFAATLSAHDLVGFAALFSEDYINQQTSAAAPRPPAGASDKQATMGFFASRLKGLPDLAVSIEAMVAGGDKAAASFVYQGTHLGPLLGVPPTGRPMRFTSCDIFRVANGQIVEHWGMGDIAGQLAQMKG
jgi:predicted ester cyclase